MALTQVNSDGIKANAVNTSDIADDAVTADKLANTSVTAGSYTASNITVDAQGRITAASSGTTADADKIEEGNTSVECVDTGSDGHITFDTEGSERMRIASNGRVGIATSSPSFPLHIATTSSEPTAIALTSNSTTSYNPTGFNAGARLRLTAGSATDSFSGITFGSLQNAEGMLGFVQNSSGYNEFVIQSYRGSYSEKFRIDDLGNVGIGDSDPSEKLDVNGNAKANHILSDGNFIGRGNLSGSDSRSGVTAIGPASDTTPRAFQGAYAEFYGGAHSSKAGELKLGTGMNTAGPIIFELNTNEEARFNSSGIFLHGKTSENHNVTGVEIKHTGGSNGQIVATNSGLCIRVNRHTSTGEVIQMMKSGTIVGRISVSGSSTSYSTTSDYRLKENVVNLDGAINRVKQLAPKRFNFIVEPDETVDGFLAHEAQTVVPEAVIGTHNEVDNDGNPVMQEIDQSKLVPLLTAALQEAIAKIETLETKVAALEAAA
jgi:uncharacterized membrane protein